MFDASKSKVVLITGAGAGIGAETAVHFAQARNRVVLAVRQPGKAAELVRRIEAAGSQAIALACDVRNPAKVEKAVADAVAHFGGIDVVVNNAGRVDPIGRIAETDIEAWRETLETNLFGAYLVVHATLEHLLRSRGVVVNISTGAAHTAREGWSAYCASKAGLAMFTRSIAHEYGSQGIRAFGVQPGMVDTSMQSKIRASGINEISRIKREQLLDPAKPASAIAWLCENAPGHLSGNDLTLDDLRREAGDLACW